MCSLKLDSHNEREGMVNGGFVVNFNLKYFQIMKYRKAKEIPRSSLLFVSLFLFSFLSNPFFFERLFLYRVFQVKTQMLFKETT